MGLRKLSLVVGGMERGAGGTVVAREGGDAPYPAQQGTSEAGQRPAMLWKSSETPPLTRTALDQLGLLGSAHREGHIPGGSRGMFL